MTMQMTETTHVSLRWLQSAAAIVAGVVTCAVPAMALDALAHGAGFYPPLGEPQPSWTLAVALAYRTLFTIAGGYVAAMLAPRHKLGHAVALGVIGLLPAIAGAVAMWSYGDQWYALALIALAVPSTWLGGRLQTRR